MTPGVSVHAVEPYVKEVRQVNTERQDGPYLVQLGIGLRV